MKLNIRRLTIIPLNLEQFKVLFDVIYMTEVVKSMCQWALSDKKVLRVIAGTDKNNIASQRVLKKCSFIIYDEDHENYLWQLNNKLS
ncbi:GNAT family N-acetyltransferase [Clostridium kluyveri]|uniref:N-acetyltransferase domain-containing protein n=1 Tax=Clostridium kluyveri (strain ATCC 8527 / DSM 555 / NBRC 12016 / NCIMB 10680 / K1) TaxID=431943 RepID=A5N0W4_CLOK5|nr:GNAT family N-acetyltransferase [Clostridium kluyveri]EDK34760.1 Conserved hypothetical protein [Clostridium kluyveri DSM 555]